MAELAKMYPPQANTPETSLSGALTAAGTTVNVVDGTMLPDAPNLLTIGADGSTAETVLMTAKNGNVLTVVRGQDGTTARAWSAGDVIGRYFTAADQKAMQDNITALNNGKTEKVSSPVSGNLVAFDGTTGKQKDSGKKPGDFAAASHTHSGYVEKVSSPVSGNLVAFDGTTGKQKDSGKKPGDFAAASHSHSGYAQALIFQNVSVAASAWRSDSTYAAYPYAATLTLTGVTASHVPEVTFGATEAASGIYAPSRSGQRKPHPASTRPSRCPAAERSKSTPRRNRRRSRCNLFCALRRCKT
jgi:hypothetical protein